HYIYCIPPPASAYSLFHRLSSSACLFSFPVSGITINIQKNKKIQIKNPHKKMKSDKKRYLLQ
ncbi:hypothetical protein, partial [Klebsiella michiganensis]|uniref:hypothetical protein n=1 Tax=Klebsiella michiganensis TaxID=1134687 RepID=UPI001C813F69